MSPVDRTRGDATGDARERRDADPDGPTDNGKVRARARPSCALFAINIHYNHAPAQALQTDTRSDALALRTHAIEHAIGHWCTVRGRALEITL